MVVANIIDKVLLLLLGSVGGAGAQGWTTITVYDVLPQDCRHTVANKDLGDPAGDAYFNLKDVYLPVACPSCQGSSHGCRTPATFDCNNPESHGNLVVRQVSVEVLRPYGTYELCNDDASGSSCAYSCQAMSHFPKRGVGKEGVCGGDWRAGCSMAPTPGSFGNNDAWDYWDYNTAVLMGRAQTIGHHDDHSTDAAATTGEGQWYSLSADDEGTYWRNATIVKTINAACQRVALQQTVQQRGYRCFDRCADRTNTSDPCWVRCYFDTVLGNNSASSMAPTGGMSSDEVVKAWLQGFQSDDPSQGGCPPCPKSGDCPAPDTHSAAAVRGSRVAPRAASWHARDLGV